MNAVADTGTDRVREAPSAAVTSSPRRSALPPCPAHHVTVGGSPQNLLSGAQSTLPPPTAPTAWRVKETSSPPIFWDEYCLFPLPHQKQGQHLPYKMPSDTFRFAQNEYETFSSPFPRHRK